MAQKQMHNDPSANALRFKLLGASASELGLKQTEAFPRVYGIIMDWNVNGMISSTIALYDGNASIYGPIVNISDNLKTKRVRDAAAHFVSNAEKYYDSAAPAIDYPYPKLGAVRFYVLCFDGNRVIESTESALGSGNDKSSSLWKAAQILMHEIHSVAPASTEPSEVVKRFFRKKNWIDLLLLSVLLLLLSYRFIGRTFLGSGPWLSQADAERTPINGLVHFVIDNHSWLLVPLIVFLLITLPSHWNKWRT